MVAACFAKRLWARTMRSPLQIGNPTPLALGAAACMVVGSLDSPHLSACRDGVRTLGLGRMADLPATDPAPDGAQSWTSETTRAAGAVSIIGSLSRNLWPDHVYA